MNKFLLCVLFLACLCSGTASAVMITANASLDYAQEVEPSNPIPSLASGEATVVFDLDTGLLDITATIDGIMLDDIIFPSGGLSFAGIGPFHIHQGAAGTNGPPVIVFPNLAFYSSTPTGIAISAMDIAFDLTLESAIRNSELYLNLHTLDYASGEVRGQLTVVPEPSVLALMAFGMLGASVSRKRLK
ncbi:MAG: CHRD domain-containing protein [Pseudomonadota bacterium]